MARDSFFVLLFLLGLVIGGLSVLFLHPMPTHSTVLAPGEKIVPVLAVDRSEHGMVGNLSVRLVPGNGNILVDTSPFTDPDLQYSAQVAALVAQRITGIELGQHDFVFSYHMPEQLSVDIVGGGSGGAAATIAAIAALENKTVRPDVALTGTINIDGSIGKVGAILAKAHAAADSGYTTFLVPRGETSIPMSEEGLASMRSAPSTMDLQEVARDWGLTVKEVSTIDDVVKEMIE